MNLLEKVRAFFLMISRNSVFQHFILWLIVVPAFIIAKGSFQPGNSWDFVLLMCIGLIVPIIAAYFFNYFLVPRFYNQKYFLTFFVLSIMTIYLFSALARVVIVHVAEPLVIERPFSQESVQEILFDYSYLIETYMPTLFLVSFSLAFVKQQKLQKATTRRNLLLEKEKAEAELKFLKAQIHPHFLFNTLNSLYVLCLKKSDKAPEIVIKLSEILDYILYKGNEKLVPLEKEIKLIENYISLEKLRYGDRITVNFHQEIDDYQSTISPLLLLSLVENAFKHGAGSVIEDPVVTISLQVKLQQLTYKVYNTRNGHESNAEMNHRKGIGLANLQKQLAIAYEEFDINILAGEEDYCVKMWINLASATGKKTSIPKVPHPVAMNQVKNEKVSVK